MKKSDILIALLAVGMCTACTHDGERIVNMGQEVVSPTNTNMPPELRLTYGAASTRAESIHHPLTSLPMVMGDYHEHQTTLDITGPDS